MTDHDTSHRPAGARTVHVTVAGHRYRIERRPGTDGPGTVTEFWPGHGLISSHRRWLGDRHARRVTWSAAVNPTGTAFHATAHTEGLPSRRAAITWLLAHTTTTEGTR